MILEANCAIKCPRCQGTGKDRTALAIRVKVPNTIPGLDRYKLAQPLCGLCGGTGKRLQEQNIAPD